MLRNLPIFQNQLILSDNLLNNYPSISSGSANGEIGVSLPTISLQEIYLVAYYKDGSDSTLILIVH